MGRGLGFLCVLLLFARGGARADPEAPFTDCDLYAASEWDHTKSGVPFEKIDPKIAIPACEDAVRTYPGSARLVFELGRSYLKSGDFGAALIRFRQGAGQGYPPALNAIGTMYSNGSGVPKDEGEAVNWYQKAAERGYVAAQMNLGFMYENGRGVPRDYLAALEWYRKAADQGAAQAQDSIGYFYSQGMGVKKDDVEAVAWFLKAAALGMAGAQYNLGTMYEHGRGVLENRSEALAWYRKAAAQGNEPAQNKLIELGASSNSPPPVASSPSPLAPLPPTEAEVSVAKTTQKSSEARGEVPQAQALYCDTSRKYFPVDKFCFTSLWRTVPDDSWGRAAIDFCIHTGDSTYANVCREVQDHNPQLYQALLNDDARKSIEDAARKRKEREAEEAKLPKAVSVIAQGVSVVPGAIVCPNYNTVQSMFDWYVAHWTDTQQDALTNGQSRLLRGQPTPAPDLKFYGCALLPPGTPMMLERGNIVPVVTATLADGTTIRGVTLAAMIAGQ